MRIAPTVVAVAAALAAAGSPLRAEDPPALRDPLEKRFGAVRQLTAGGANAEAYFSADGKRIVFQSTRPPYGCDQIFTMNLDGSDVRLASTGKGRTTCSFFFPDGKRIVYASTHAAGEGCLEAPDRSKGYVWKLYPEYDIYAAGLDGSAPVRLTDTPGYDAEAAVSPDGSRIVFTSVRDGDLDIYTMRPDGTGVRRLTDEPGYDGGPFFSWDGKKIVYRCFHPSDPAELAKYRDLLAKGLVQPGKMDLWIMDPDGSNKRQLTNLGKASFGPYLHPDGRRVLFSSNWEDPKGREFEIYSVDVETGRVERVTNSPQFDGFPMFTPDGKTLVFCSNRLGEKPNETNVFLADWVE
jgi:Tol biopolymer transport system component